MIPKLVIFDADGTLRRCTVEGQPCPNAPDQWELLPNVKETLAEFQHTLFAVASNQAGVALGYMTERMARRLLISMCSAAFGDHPVLIELCPHAPDADCDCRKPRPKMLSHCMHFYLVAPHETLYVGDMETDKQAAENAGCTFMWARDFFGWNDDR